MYKHKYWRSRACLYCGKEFKHPAHQTERKYCSRQCGSKATYNRRHPNSPDRVWGHEKGVFDAAMEMYWNGEESGVISRKLNIPVGTIYSWVHDFGNKRQRKEPLKKLLYMAKSAEEWLDALRNNTVNESFDDMPIRLVCGMFHGQSAERLSSIIYESLKENPMSGNIYAFCNKMRNTVTTFAWKYPVFNIAKYIKMHGTFIWPHEGLGKTIEVTKFEFDCLLFLNKQEITTEKIAKNLDIMRIL